MISYPILQLFLRPFPTLSGNYFLLKTGYITDQVWLYEIFYWKLLKYSLLLAVLLRNRLDNQTNYKRVSLEFANTELKKYETFRQGQIVNL